MFLNFYKNRAERIALFSLLEMKAKVSRGQAELPYFIDSKLHQRKEALFFSVLPVKLGQRKGEKTILRNLSNGIERSGMRMLLF